MLQVTYLSPSFGFIGPLPFPADLDAWRKLLGGPIDIFDCEDTVCPCVIVMLFPTARVANAHVYNPVASEFVKMNVLGPAVLVAGADAVDLLDEQTENWEGDEPEEMRP